MANGTGIQWTDTTWNPLRGCSRVSEGCRNCYAEKQAARFCGPGQPYEGLVTVGEKGPRWSGHVRMVPEKLAEPLRWKKPQMVFVNSMSDLFHESVSFEDIAAIFGVMAVASKHVFQVLTKRPGRALEFFEWHRVEHALGSPPVEPKHAHVPMHYAGLRLPYDGKTWRTASWPLPNVWLGVSVEDQATADERLPLLLQCPAAVRWVSYEPALGPIDFRWWLDLDCDDGPPDGRGARLGWVVIGGESGPGARPFDIAWARSTVEECKAAGVPCFVKQLGARAVDTTWETGTFAEHDKRAIAAASDLGAHTPPALLLFRNRKGGDMSEWPEELRVREWPGVAHG